MGLFKGFKESLTGEKTDQIEKLGKELIELRQQMRSLENQKGHAAAHVAQGATTEHWTREDTVREGIVQKRITEVSEELRNLGMDV